MPDASLVLGTEETGYARCNHMVNNSVKPTATRTDSSDAAFYVKGGKVIFEYLDGATVRYKYLDLTGTGVTWIHTTVAP